jgi:hypothetical protein
MDTLAARLTIPPVGPVEDFHLQVGAPCRARTTPTLYARYNATSRSICTCCPVSPCNCDS